MRRHAERTGNRYLETGSPRNLTLLYAAGQGDGKERGLNHLGEEGLLKRTIGGHWNLAGRLQKLALEEKMEAYNLPQGVIAQMYREIAAGRPTLSRIGLHTFVDPRLQGGRLNCVTKEEIVHLMEIAGEETVVLTEIAPGIDLHKDVLDHMEFECVVSTDLKKIDERIFREEKMGLVKYMDE